MSTNERDSGLSKLSSTRGIHEYQFTCEQQQIHEHKHQNTKIKLTQIHKRKYTNTHVKYTEIPTHEKQPHLQAVKNAKATKNVTRA